MKFVTLLLAATIAAFQPVKGHAWFEPAWGSDLRRDLMNAIRPQAEAELGAPVQFVVDTLRINGNVGFAALQPQRPGGVPIRWEDTPMAARGADPQAYDGATIHVLYTLTDAAWEVFAWTVGSTDVWWADPQLCATHSAVTPEVC